MSLELCILASGSAGNCSAIRTPAGVMLIDAGIGPRTLGKRLRGTGTVVQDVRAICLTHLDSDHFRATWLNTIVQQKIALFCHETRRDDLLSSAGLDRGPGHVQQLAALVQGFNGEPFEPMPGVVMRAVALAHDRLGSHGFVIDGFGGRIGYASDLGRVPPDLARHFCDLDVLAMESNYDPEMEMSSPRPWFLKNRIMGGRGHLSNQQALEAIQQILDRCEKRRHRLPEHIVLLHRSRQCNCPRLMRKLFSRDARIAPRLTVAEQYHRSEWLRPARTRPQAGEQLTLTW
jgi:phosphoribosyl 1,2-cyclic phosphodiesterase